jgi:pimeloyl-ACP methyl ester carboxylesterase
MTTAQSSTCPLTSDNLIEADCAKRLLLRDCLDGWARDAQEGELDTGRYVCRYAAWGHGPTLVLIPGIAGDALSFVMLMARLQSHFRCITFNLPDGVDDRAKLRRYAHQDLVSDLFALLDHLKIRDCSLLGFSFGSTIALSALHQQAGRFNRAILSGGFAHHPLAPAEAFCATWGRFLPGRLASLPFFEQTLAKAQREPFLAQEAEVWDYFVERQGRTLIRAFAGRALLMHQIDLRPILANIPVPILLVNGDRASIVDKRCAEDLQRGLPFVAQAVIEQCGHQGHLSHPEVLAEVVRQFLLPGPCRSQCE